jgi:hypothetical protein
MVSNIAEHLLQRERFDADLDSEEEETEWSESETESEEDSSSSDDDYYKSKKKKSKKRKTKKTETKKTSKKVKIASTDEKEAKSPMHKGTPVPGKASTEDIESHIRQLNEMSLQDPQYGLVYYRMVCMDPSIISLNIVRPPLAHPPAYASRTPTPQTSAPASYPYQPSSNYTPQTPATGSNWIPVYPTRTSQAPAPSTFEQSPPPHMNYSTPPR